MAANPSDSPRHFYTLDEYFALERAGDARYEYWNGDIVCMSGGSLAHCRIASNVHLSLGRKLAGGPCVAFTEGLPVKTPTLFPYRYPDASVVCGDPKVENIQGVDALLNPILIVEVLSPSSESRDRGDKLTACRQIVGFQDYLLVAQQVPRVIRYLRQVDGDWSEKEIIGMDGIVRLGSIPCELSLAEIYEGVI
jgi:Uma2 family endonuclease